MAEGGVLSYGTHRYLIVHTWVGLKHSDTMAHTQREGGREGGKTQDRRKWGKKTIKPKKFRRQKEMKS